MNSPKSTSSNPNDKRKFYHYTNMQALLSIVRYDSVRMWATHYNFLNDKKEIKRGIELIRKYNPIEDDIFKNLFIISLSRTVDDLSMWLNYSDGYNGCILGFNDNILLSRNHTKCYYDISEVEKLFMQNINFIDNHVTHSSSGLIASLMTKSSLIEFAQYGVCLSLKDPSFKFENEWRLTWMIEDDETNLIKYRNRNGLITPYIEYDFPKSVLSEVWIPNNEKTEMNKKSLLNMLKQYGYYDVEVKISKTPYRNI